jgi:hypothetical protein
MYLNSLKKIARDRLVGEVKTFQEFMSHLKIWWSEKYKLPMNHELLLQLSTEELIIQYFTDLFRRDPKELEKFESDQLGDDSIKNDEAWFKRSMKEEYTEEEAFSSGFREQLKTNTKLSPEQKKKIEEVEETLEFNILGE